MALIGVISDTHGRLDGRAFDLLAAADCDVIIHAGDVGSSDVMIELGALAPVMAVLGNNDYPSAEVNEHIIHPVIGGVRFVVAHYPRDVMLRLGSPAVTPGTPLPQVCIHGHTHVPEITTGKAAGRAQMVFCPGSVTYPRGGQPRSLGFITVNDGRLQEAQIVSLTGVVLLRWPPSGH